MSIDIKKLTKEELAALKEQLAAQETFPNVEGSGQGSTETAKGAAVIAALQGVARDGKVSVVTGLSYDTIKRAFRDRLEAQRAKITGEVIE